MTNTARIHVQKSDELSGGNVVPLRPSPQQEQQESKDPPSPQVWQGWKEDEHGNRWATPGQPHSER